MKRLLVASGGRFAVVTIDEHASQCTTPAARQARTSGPTGSYVVQGVGDASVDRCARYAVQHGRSWSRRAAAVAALAADGWIVAKDGSIESD